jgi:ribose/xylose/arabinose/galactoside ABC-type transport system permease subunit
MRGGKTAMIDRNRWFGWLYRLRILLLIVLLLIIFSAISPGFISKNMLRALMVLLPAIGCVAIGETLVIITGNLDLSVGGILSLSGLVLVRTLPFGVPVALILSIGSGIFVGLLNGLIINKLKVNSLITTIAMTFVLNGVVFFFAEGTIHFENNFLVGLGHKALWIFPWAALFYFAVTVIIQLLLKRTVFGIKLYAIGNNRNSSSYSGIKVDRVGMLAFILCGLFAALGGILLSSNLAAASPIYGSETAITVLTAVLLGGTVITGGSGDVVKTLTGVVFIILLTKGLSQIGVAGYYQNMIIGGLLIGLLYSSKRLTKFNI